MNLIPRGIRKAKAMPSMTAMPAPVGDLVGDAGGKKFNLSI
jgi:hypothetical protein